ncbi:S8 family serine peptidase [Aquibaculum sediminis]|uniref:S8 family serine peptidase n=1 Tax=Aquibaculum sediminis TaxID=3231907 RepID=UPI003452854D
MEKKGWTGLRSGLARSVCITGALTFVWLQAAAAWAQDGAAELEPESETPASEASAPEEAGAFNAEVLVPVGLGLALGGSAVLLATGGDDGGERAPRWARSATRLPYDAGKTAEFRPGGFYRDEMMALSETRRDDLVGFNPYELVNAPEAYGYGATGKGQTIAVLDDGFQLDHPEIASKIESVYQRDALPVEEHGTHVAGLAAGARNGRGSFGMAFDARLHLGSNEDFVGDLGFSPAHWAKATDAARHAGAAVQSNSWGFEGQGMERVRTQDVNRVVADPDAIDELAPDVRRDINAFLRNIEVDREELRGDPAAAFTVFVQSLVLADDAETFEGVADWLPEDWSAYVSALDAFQKKGVVVFALSNNAALPFADSSAALPEVFPELKEAWITVANVDFTYDDPDDRSGSALRAARWSAPCAETAAYCISHDGTEVLSSVPVDDYASFTGTSMATPQVSGAVAILAQAFPDHTPAQLAARLFASAENFGDWEELKRRGGTLVGRIGDREIILAEGPGEIGESEFAEGVTHAHSSVYGHGFMDLAAAMQPIGGPPLVYVGGDLQTAKRFDIAASRVRLGPAFGDGLARSLANLDIMTFDRLGGGFNLPVESMVQVNTQVTEARDLLSAFARKPERHSIALGGGAALEVAFRPQPQASLTPISRSVPALEAEALITLPLSESVSISGWSNRSPMRSFGLQAEERVQEEMVLGREAFTNPFLGFVSRGHGGAVELGSGDTGALRLGIFEGLHRDTWNWRQEDRNEDRVWGAAAEVSLPFGKAGEFGSLALTGGLLNESGTILGAKTSGAFETKGDTPTWFTGLSGSLALDRLGFKNVSLVGSAYWGWTQARTSSTSLFGDVSTIASESYSIGLQGQELFDARDRFALTLNQPLRVRSGSARMDLPVGRTTDLRLRHRSMNLNLTPSGREVSLEASYGFALNEAIDLSGAVMLRRQPGHQRDAGREGIGLAKLRINF